MSSVVISGDTSGAITLAAPTVAGATTITLPATTGTMALTTGQIGMKNRIINGNMVIDQRNAGASVSIDGAASYTLDRYLCQDNTDGSFSVQQSSTAPTGFNNSLLATITGTDSSLTTTQFGRIVQRIEGYNMADLGWGTASAKTVTLSFWVCSSVTGTFSGTLTNNAGDRVYAFTYTISSANTWEQESITIAGDTTGTWLTTNGTGIELNLSIGAGPDRSVTAGSWGTSLAYAATGQTNLFATSGATFYITGVQLEVGSAATTFDFRSYTTELANCQRYYQRLNSNGNRDFNGYVYSASLIVAQLQLPVPMRAAVSTLTTSGTAGDYTIFNTSTNTSTSTVPALNTGGINTICLTAAPTGLTAGQGIALGGTNTNAYYAFSAEL
jgi:hypothetical protein